MTPQTPDQLPPLGPRTVCGAEHLTAAEVRWWLRKGATGVRYEYCISFGVVTLQFRSRLHLIDTQFPRYAAGLPYSLLALALGPWGLPWGPVLTARAIWTNLGGGIDCSAELDAALSAEPVLPAESP